MEDEQDNLIASFPGFIEAIADIIDEDAEDFHIMVTDSDACYSSGQSTTSCGSPGCCIDACANEPPSSCLQCAEDSTNYKWCVEWQGGEAQCNPVLGAGHVGNNLNADCPVEGDKRYLTTAQDDLDAAFPCIAEVGTEGFGFEKNMEAMVEAIGPLTESGACNEGFIRPEAARVIVFITDEEDGEMGEAGSAGDPIDWYNAVLDAKGGNERGIVVMGLFGDNDLPNPVCEDADGDGNGAEPAPGLREFLEYFPEDRSHFCSVCLDDYTDCFLEATRIIAFACDDIIIE